MSGKELATSESMLRKVPEIAITPHQSLPASCSSGGERAKEKARVTSKDIDPR